MEEGDPDVCAEVVRDCLGFGATGERCWISVQERTVDVGVQMRCNMWKGVKISR